jgi:hypothetical protein
MITLTRASGELVVHLAAALTALAAHLDAPSDDQLGVLEAQIDKMQELRRDVEKEVDRSGTKFTTTNLGEFYRVFVVFESVLSLLDLKTPSGRSWGAHLFGDHDFDSITFDRFEVPKEAYAVTRMLADQAADLGLAANWIANYAQSHVVFDKTGMIKNALSSVTEHFDCKPVDLLEIDLVDDAWVRDQLGIGPGQLTELVTKRKVFTVPTWSGEIKYPQFQFVAGQIVAPLSKAYQQAAPGFDGWPFAVWAYGHRSESAAYFQKKLEPRGLWLKTWRARATNQFKDLDASHLHDIAADTPLYRITTTGYSPYFFASVAQRGSKPKSESRKYPGRFDLEGDRGTVYLAETADGAWREVLDREPVVTLRKILNRTSWTLTPTTTIKVADVTPYPADLSTCAIRADTMQLANRLAANQKGMRYGLRSSGSQLGIALFGPSGPSLPSRAGLGIWGATSVNGIHDPALWEYLKVRENDEHNVVVLRRFPDEIKVHDRGRKATPAAPPATIAP